MAAVPVKTNRKPDPTVDDYMPISLATLVPGQSMGIRLYLRGQEAGVRLYKSAEYPFEAKDRDHLLSLGRRTLLIKKADSEQYQQYLRDNLEETINDENVSVTSRAACLGEVVRDVMQSSFLKGNTEEIVEATTDIADDCVSILSRDDLMPHELSGVLHHDYHTFTHSTNVAFYAVMLAKALGINDEEELKEIAVGGFIHDLGKIDIPSAILNKPDRLTQEEMEVIREHPRAGFRRVCHREDISQGQMMMIYQHHERLDGEGYPVGVPKSEIHPWAKLCMVVDVYEALTANRPYRKGLPFEKVELIMRRDDGTAFDSEMLKCWLTIMAKKSQS